MTQTDRPIGIVGGLGKTGRRVADGLARAGLPVRALSRSTSPAFDWERPQDWGAALEGIDAAYVTFQPDLSAPGADALIGQLAEVAIARGVTRIVLLSGRGEPGALLAEQALAKSGLPWAVIRSSWFAQNFSESFLAESVARGELVLPAGTAAEPFVDADDIATVAIALLTGRAPLGRVYEVTGPRALRFTEACAILSQATGRTVACREVSRSAFEDHLRAGGLPEDVVAMLSELFTTTLDGRNSATANGVEDALGRPARSFEEYAQALAADQAR